MKRLILGFALLGGLVWLANEPAQVSARFLATSSAKVIVVNAPASVQAGVPFTATVTMQNTGTDTWAVADYKLGALNDSTNWTINRVLLAAPVPPGGQGTFTLNVTAVAAGPFQWRMVHENVAWFGDTASANVAVSGGGGGGSGAAYPFPSIVPGDISGATILVSASSPNDKQARKVQWVNTSGQTLHVFKTMCWSGITKGCTADVDCQVNRDRDGMPLAHNQTDHYSEMSFPAGNCIQYEFSTPFLINPGESITMTYVGNPITGGGQNQHNFKIWAK